MAKTFTVVKIAKITETKIPKLTLKRLSFFEHRTNLNVFIYLWSNSNTLFLALNDRTSNFEPNRAFTRFTKLLIKLTGTSFFEHRTNSNLFIYWQSNSNILLLALNDRTSNIVLPITSKLFRRNVHPLKSCPPKLSKEVRRKETWWNLKEPEALEALT